MIEAFNIGVPGFASSVVKDNEEDLSSLTVMLKTVSQKRLCSLLSVGDKRCVDKFDNSLKKIIISVKTCVC